MEKMFFSELRCVFYDLCLNTFLVISLQIFLRKFVSRFYMFEEIFFYACGALMFWK